MLFRSTGLGKAELIAEVVDIKRQGDYIIMEVQTSEPVRWKIRGGVNHQDIRRLLKVLLKASVLGFLLDPREWFRPPTHPGTY